MLRVPRVGKVSRVPMRYVAPSTNSQKQDYLAADLSPSYLEDDDRTATVNLRNLPPPNRFKPTVGQNNASSKAKPQIILATTRQSDLDQISQQKVCPSDGIGTKQHGHTDQDARRWKAVVPLLLGLSSQIQRRPGRPILPRRSERASETDRSNAVCRDFRVRPSRLRFTAQGPRLHRKGIL